MFAELPLTDPLQAELQQLIRDHAAEAPRSQQHNPGCSEIGDPCRRRLAYKILNVPKVNLETDPLPATDGTAFHTWVEAAVLAYNRRHGRTRFIAEQQVIIRPGLTGTVDVYDFDTQTVIDWKRPGKTRYDHYRNHGPSQQYRTQVHLYGLGYEKLGLPVKRVGIMFIKRGGLLSDSHLWIEPYDIYVATAALDRYDQLLLEIQDRQLETSPDGWEHITPTYTDCIWCAWWKPESQDLSAGCPGDITQ